MRRFQPNGKCGNCHWLKHSVKVNGVVIEDTDCRKGNDPKTCPPEDFMSRSKKKAKKKHKSWQSENRRSKDAERRFHP
ncbi:MAG: hypothetical protein JSW41_05070 [Candidatus Aenigmatarchaeota archaeon]|nr:MAG: hypothetical protein JSW41_05070 [Candidatus Aenigmarchaeota archaeon]